MKWIVLAPLSVLGALAALLVLAMLLRIGVRVHIRQETMDVWLRIACARIHIYPRAKKPERKPQKSARRPKSFHKEVRVRAKKPGPSKARPAPSVCTADAKPDPDFSIETLCAYVRLGMEAAGRLLSGLRIDLLHVRADIAASDAAKTALAYGSACAAVSCVHPLMERALRIRRQNISINACFEKSSTELEVDLIVTALLGRLLFIGLRILHKYSKLKKAVQKNEQPQ